MIRRSRPLLLTFRRGANHECFVNTFSNLPWGFLRNPHEIFHKDSCNKVPLLIFEKDLINIERNYFKLLGKIILKLEEFC